MDELNNSKAMLQRAGQVMLGHISKLQKLGKTVDEVVEDEATQRYLKSLVKTEFRMMNEFNKKKEELKK